MLDKLSLEDFAPVRSRSAPGDSGGAKSSESVVGAGGARASDSDTFAAFAGVVEAEGAGAWAWVGAGDGGAESEAACAGFFGGIGPDFTENVRVKWAEGVAVARRRAVREKMAEYMNCGQGT